eukprot:5293487-Pyramimonas_sp.AAC.1
MPALFCLAINIALRRINERLPPGAEVLAYLDDIYVICDPGEVAHVMATVRNDLSTSCHIDVNVGKLAI